MKLTPGRFQVVRFCCTSGQCISCRSFANGYGLSRRQRVVHIDGLDQPSAAFVAKNWAAYGAEVEPMPEVKADA